jgi:hypothetical protein
MRAAYVWLVEHAPERNPAITIGKVNVQPGKTVSLRYDFHVTVSQQRSGADRSCIRTSLTARPPEPIQMPSRRFIERI